MKFKTILNDNGKNIFKGGNIEVMRNCLIEFEAIDISHAKGYFYNWTLSHGGSTMQDYFMVVKL